MIRTFSCTLLWLVTSVLSVSAQHRLGIGFNVTRFADWSANSSLYFNPKVSYAQALNPSWRLRDSFDVFYGGSNTDFQGQTGRVYNRLIFSNDIAVEFHKGRAFVAAGPTVRFRREKRIVCLNPGNCQPLQSMIIHNSNVDLGGLLAAGFTVPLGQRSELNIALTYRLYMAGASPLSLGGLYERLW